MTSTIWPARRVGDVILCGHLVGGRYDCQGEIAVVDKRRRSTLKARLPGGLTAVDPLAEGDAAHWRETSRAQSQRDRGQRTRGHGVVGDNLVGGRRFPEWAIKTRGAPEWSPAAMPFTRACPHCRCIGRVDSAVLDSAQE